MRGNEKVSSEKVAQCETRAHRIVERFLDPVTDEAEFLSQLRWINPDHYQCITEERAIQKTCGYPLCEEKLVNIPTKKYQICTKENKVYDITYRKIFCSNRCYKASSYLKQQLLTSPLWIREKEENPKFNLLKNSSELFGEEINFGIERVSLFASELLTDREEAEESKIIENNLDHNPSFPNVSNNCSVIKNNDAHDPRVSLDDSLLHHATKTTSMTNSTSTEIDSKNRNCFIADGPVNQTGFSSVKKCFENDRDNQSAENNLPVNLIQNVSSVSFATDDTAESNARHHPKSNSKNFSRNIDCPKNYKSSAKPPDLTVRDNRLSGSANIVFRVEKCIREWCTIDTYSFIMGVEYAKLMMLEKSRIFEAKDQAKHDAHFYERYAAVFNKLKILEIEEKNCTNEVKPFEKPTRPLPDFSTLKKQTQEIEIKVRAFYRGDKKVTFGENKNENDENETPVVLPTLHQHTKIIIRRNIVLDKLKAILPDLAVMLGLRTIDLNDKIKQLALSCKFEAHNVTFKPVEWNLVGLIFIKLLSLRYADIQKCLREKENYVNAVLMSYQLENNYLDLLCTWLMDLDQILKNEEEPS